MSRDVATDFSAYVAHLEAFSFGPLMQNSKYVASIKPLHKAFLSILTLVMELTDPEGDGADDFLSVYGKKGAQYLQEVISDVGQAIFCFGAGAYKASLVTLRSAIESYAKAFSAAHDPKILTQKSVTGVFDIAKAAPFFASGPGKRAIGDMLATYDALNLFVHTVTDRQMFKLLGLGVFPGFEEKRADAVRAHLAKTIRSMTFGIASTLHKEFFRIHYRNRDIILAGLAPTQRAALHRAN